MNEFKPTKQLQLVWKAIQVVDQMRFFYRCHSRGIELSNLLGLVRSKAPTNPSLSESSKKQYAMFSCDKKYIPHLPFLGVRSSTGSASRQVMAGSSKHQSSAADLEERVRQLYDYDAIIAQAPNPEEVHWVFGCVSHYLLLFLLQLPAVVPTRRL